MNKVKVADFITFIKSKMGCYYWFGTFGQKASKALYAEKKKQYPKYYTASDYEKQIANPKQCFDCAGLVKSLFVYPTYHAEYDLGATGIYGKCTKKGKLTSLSQLKDGYLIFKGNDKQKTHVAVYIGGKVYEAKGHAYGCLLSKFVMSQYPYYAEYYMVDYSDQPAPDPSPKEGDILEVTTRYTELMLRSYASTSAPVVQRMKKGWKVTYLGEKKEDSTGLWYKVRCNTVIGWSCAKEKSKDYWYLTKV